MIRKLAMAALAMALAAPQLARAHEPSKHKGRPTEGDVVSVSGDRMQISTARGPKTVILDNKTKIERGAQAATAGDLKKGEHVVVFGTTLASGEVVSHEIVIGKPEGHGAHKAKGETK